MRFTKMHGIGNDYVYVDGFAETVDDPSALAAAISDRHFGVGGDGLVLILPSEVADIRMRMFNADGSEGMMCGNAIRCVARYAHEHQLATANPVCVETASGVKTIVKHIDGEAVASSTVDMGEPILTAAEIPVRFDEDPIVDVPAEALVPMDGPAGWTEDCKLDARATCVSMGNPHLVLFCGSVADVPLAAVGPEMETAGAFPDRINVHFAHVDGDGELTMRTWERGSGITLACGTGASAVCVAAVLTGRAGRDVQVHLPGGDLRIEWRQSDNHVYMTGPAEYAFEGDWPD